MTVGICGPLVPIMAHEEAKMVSSDLLAGLYPPVLHDFYLPAWPCLPNVPWLSKTEPPTRKQVFKNKILEICSGLKS